MSEAALLELANQALAHNKALERVLKIIEETKQHYVWRCETEYVIARELKKEIEDMLLGAVVTKDNI